MEKVRQSGMREEPGKRQRGERAVVMELVKRLRRRMRAPTKR